MRTQKGRVPVANGHPPAPVEEARSVQIASGGLRSTADICRFGSSLATDVMNDRIDGKKLHGSVRALNLTLRAAEFQFKYGENGRPVMVADLEGDATTPVQDADEEREQELIAELNRLRSRRGAR